MKIAVSILIESARGGANQFVGPNEIGLAGFAKAFPLPAAVPGDDIVDLLIRQVARTSTR